MVQRRPRHPQGDHGAYRWALRRDRAADTEGLRIALHVHRDEDELFLVLSGEVRLQHGDTVIEAVAGSLVYGPRNVPHAFRVDSDEARMLLIFAPAGVEEFFRQGGKSAGSLTLPPAGEEFLDRQALMEIGGRFNQQFVGPPLPPKDSALGGSR